MSTDRGAITELEAALTSRHRAVSDAGRWLVVNPALPDHLATVSRLFERLAGELLELVPLDDPELTRALTGLTQAKDSAVRAAIVAADHQERLAAEDDPG